MLLLLLLLSMLKWATKTCNQVNKMTINENITLCDPKMQLLWSTLIYENISRQISTLMSPYLKLGTGTVRFGILGIET